MHRLLVLLLLAGCVTPQVQPVPSDEMWIEGVVVDEGIRTIANATVRIGDQEVAVASDGSYRINGSFEIGDLLIAAAPGHVTQSHLLTRAAPGLVVEHDFALQPIQDDDYTDTQVFAGRIACGIVVQYGHSHGSGEPKEDNHQECPSLAEGHRIFQYIPERDPDDMLLELYWTPNNAYATQATLVLRNGGGKVIAFEEGGSPLRIEVAAVLVEEHFSDGREGIIEILPGVPHQSTADVYIGMHMDQRFDVYATTFHGGRMPAHWTID